MESSSKNNPLPSHQLSPSSWNRFEECPRKFWLSRQGLPKKSGMAASLGSAIHNSLEDICNLDLSSIRNFENGWLSESMKSILKKNWEIEREHFLSAPRHPRWKEDQFPKARAGFIGAIQILFSKTRVSSKDLSGITSEEWEEIQSIVIANEATLSSECGRLIGRLDLLLIDLFSENSDTWTVADLKTGNPPKSDLNEKVIRQLSLYRDLVVYDNPNVTSIHAEAWYSANKTIYSVDGPPVLNQAFEAWELTRPTTEPLPASPSQESCAFCEWKAWCPSWWAGRRDGMLLPGQLFRDEVVRLVRLDELSGAALFERAPPVDEDGELASSDHRFGAILKDGALDQIRQIISSGEQGPLFIGSGRVSGSVMHLGDWSEILPWEPLLSSNS